MRAHPSGCFVVALAVTAATLGGQSTLSEVIAAQAQVRGPSRAPDVIFVPTPAEVVDAMLRLAGVNESDLVYDLGSGDGRIVIAAAQKSRARGVGIDIDPKRIGEANANAARAGVTDRVRFIQADLFEADINQATVVALYLLPSLNLKLRPKP